MLSFKDSCFEAAKRFVQTAVVIDDKAGYLDVRTESEPSAPVTAPPTGLTASLDSEPIAPEENCIPDESELNQAFDINPVVNGFADLKITCSVQRPDFGGDKEQDERLKEWALNCAGHADITIIDWRLFEDDLHLAADIIIDLLKKDIETGGRVRLLCVYTVQPNPENILNDIKTRIIEDLNLSITGNKKDLAYTIDEKVRIVIFNKSATKVLYSNSKVVSFEDLPEALLKEFSVLVNGLIPCAALHSISALRERTHNILSLMNKSLDGAFCAHRALIPDVDDSIEFILNLISQEISTKILCDQAARNFLDTDSIRSWYDGQALPENQYALEKETLWEYLKNGGANLSHVRKQRAKSWLKKKEKSQNQLKDKDGKNISYSRAHALIEKGLFLEIKGCSPPSEKNPNKFAELFYPKKRELEKACNELSMLSCSSKDGSDLRKSTNDGLFLTLGSVLQVSNDDSEYWLCLQPPCDSVQLNEKTEMLFLQLYKGNEGNADFVIKLHDETYQALSIKAPGKKPRIKTHGFRPDKDSRRVSVNKLPGKHNGKFKWVAELRPEKAQTIAQKVLTNASRIGLDEFELLRRKGSQL